VDEERIIKRDLEGFEQGNFGFLGENDVKK
jgi:hypothetical protein